MTNELETELVTGTNRFADPLQAAPMRTDADEIQYRFAQSTERLRELRAQKANLFELIREEVAAHNRLARAARIYGIELEGDSGD